MHVNLDKNAEKILDNLSQTMRKSKTAILEEFIKSKNGGSRNGGFIIAEVYPSFPVKKESIQVGDDPISILQGGILKGSSTLINGESGTGKTAILLNIAAELSANESINNPVLYLTSETEGDIKKSIETILSRKSQRLLGAKSGAVNLNLRVVKIGNLLDLVIYLDDFQIEPVLSIDPFEELVDFSPERFNRDAWGFFKRELRRRKITMIRTSDLPLNSVKNTILRFDSVFNLTSTLIVLREKSLSLRCISTIKSPAGAIPPVRYELDGGVKILNNFKQE